MRSSSEDYHEFIWVSMAAPNILNYLYITEHVTLIELRFNGSKYTANEYLGGRPRRDILHI